MHFKGDYMNQKGIDGLVKATPEKRYKSFLTTVADTAEVWLLTSEKGQTTYDADGYIHILVWPCKEFAQMLSGEGEEPTSMEIHEFIEQCEKLDESIRFMVFPTKENAFVVTTETLISDLYYYLAEVE